MPSIESILSKYDPSTSAEEPQSAESFLPTATGGIDSILSKYESTQPVAQEKPQLLTPNPLVATAKSTAASMANAFAGQPLEDIGETIGSESLQNVGKGVREYAEGVQKENPSQIGSLSDIVDKPLTAVETALGNVVPQIPVSLAGGYAGAKAGAALPLPPQGKAVAAGLGGILGAFAPNYLQEAAEMRGKQHESGEEDKTKAYLTAIPAAGLETASDVLLAGKFLPKAVKETAVGKALGSIGEDTLSATGSRAAHIGKQALKGAGTEAGTEYAQSALEQLGGNQDLSTEEAQAEREVSAALGAIGGGAVGGGVSAFDKRAEELPPPATEEQVVPQEPDFAEVPDTQPQEPIIAGAPSDLDLRTDEEKTADTATELDLSVPAVDTKQTEDFLNRFENAWAGTEREPTRVTTALAEEAAKIGVPVTPNDSPMAVVAAMRAEIEARKSPEEAAQDVGDSVIAETLAAYPDGKPGIAGKAVIAGAESKVLEPQKVAAEQKVAEQQPVVEEPPVNEVVDLNTGEVTPEPTIPEERQSDLSNITDANMLRNWLAKSGKNLETAAAISARLKELAEVVPQEPTTQEAQDALEKQEASPLDVGGSPLAGTSGEDRDFASGGAGVSPEGQESRDIPRTEETILEPQTPEVEDGKSEDQTAQTTPQEVAEAPEEKARKLLVSAVPNGDLSALRGKQNTDNRVKLLEALTGQRVAKNVATNAKLLQEFYKAAGVDLNQSLAAQQKQFQAWASQAQELQEAGITEEFPIDLQAAKESAASRFNGHRELPENRDAQKKAYITIKDLNIGIENPAGTKRKAEWPELKDHYGFFTGVKGKDGDQLDVFIQPKLSPEAIENIQKVYVVDQKNEDGSFDEHKVIIGPDNVGAAKTLYLENYEPGWQGLGAITEMPFDQFKERIDSGKNWDEPVAYKESAVEENPAPEKSAYQRIKDKGEHPWQMTSSEYAAFLDKGKNAIPLEDRINARLKGKPIPEGKEGESYLKNVLIPEATRLEAILESERLGIKQTLLSGHKFQVESAVDRGEAVPDKVLDEYPDLRAKDKWYDLKDADAKALVSSLGHNWADAFGVDGYKRPWERLSGAIKDSLAEHYSKPEPPIPFSRVETSESLPELFESLGRVNKLSQLSDDQLQRIDEHPDAERIRYVQDNFLTLLSELDARPNSEFEIKC